MIFDPNPILTDDMGRIHVGEFVTREGLRMLIPVISTPFLCMDGSVIREFQEVDNGSRMVRQQSNNVLYNVWDAA